MFHFWKTGKLFAERASLLDLGLLKFCILAVGILIGVTVPRKKKIQTGVLASSVFAATCLPLLNKFFDISDELALGEQK